MLELLAVFLGGSIGASLRYLVSQIALHFGLSYQGTFIINLLGCLFLGFVSYIAIKREEKVHRHLKSFLTTGMAGGFTTFSTFSYEVFKLAIVGQIFTGLMYLFLSLVFGLISAMLGVFLAKQVLFYRLTKNTAREIEIESEETEQWH